MPRGEEGAGACAANCQRLSKAHGEIFGEGDVRGSREAGGIIRRNARSLPSFAPAKILPQSLQASSPGELSTETDSANRYSAPQCAHVTSDIFIGLHESWRGMPARFLSEL
jgi:hypothetical protein